MTRVVKFVSLVAIVLFGVMIWSYDAIGREPQAWQPTEWAFGIGAVLMWIFLVVFVVVSVQRIRRNR